MKLAFDKAETGDIPPSPVMPGSGRIQRRGKRNLNKRCAGMAVVLLLLATSGIGQAQVPFTGVLNPYGNGVVIDSVTVVPPDRTFQTPGWQAFGHDYATFSFPDLPQWPTDVWVYGTVGAFPVSRHIVGPVHLQWYPFDVSPHPAFVMFHGYGAVEESRPAVEPRQGLTVSPSVVTGQVAVRLQPVGPGRHMVQMHDAVGNVVRSLACTAGPDGAATATWNRDDDRGRLVPEGVYFCRYADAGAVAVRKVLIAD